MRYPACCLLVLFTTVLASHAAKVPTLSSAEQGVVAVSKARMEAAATRDMNTWSRYVSEDCIFSSDDGVLLTKAQMMAHYKKLPAEYDRAVDPRDHVVHIYGDVAVVNYRATTHEQFGVTDIISEQRRTETFVKQKGSWLLIAIQWDNLPINLRKPAVITGGRYRDYVGQYQWRPGDDVENIFVKDGRLMSQEGEDIAEYLPAGPDTFFLREDVGSYTFSRDSQDRVTGYIYHRFDGQEILAHKLK